MLCILVQSSLCVSGCFSKCSVNRYNSITNVLLEEENFVKGSEKLNLAGVSGFLAPVIMFWLQDNFPLSVEA